MNFHNSAHFVYSVLCILRPNAVALGGDDGPQGAVDGPALRGGFAWTHRVDRRRSFH
jgi:hypothetical protein